MFVRQVVLLAATALAILPVVSARADESLPLRHIDTSILATKLQAHPEFNGVVLYPSSNTVELRGTEDQIARAKSAIALLDVVQFQYSIKVSIVRCTVDATGKATERTVMAPLISLLDGQPADLAMDTQAIALTLTSSQDGNVNVAGEFRHADEAGDIGLWAKNERRVALNTKVRFLGLTDSPDKSLRKAVREGKMVTDRGAYTAYYYDLTVQRIDPATDRPQ